MKQTDMIAAISTPIGRGAISIVRMSGNGVLRLASEMFSPFPASPSLLKLGTLDAGGFCDKAMCVYFKAPRSYTGEDMVEFQLHGGYAIADGVLKNCVERGCRLAVSGEFTKRAYLNGKMNLTNVEGIMDMIDAESVAAVENGYKMLTGRLDGKISALQDKLTDLLAQIEVALDYPEEDLEYITNEQIGVSLGEVLGGVNAMLDSVSRGRMIKSGVDVAIIGRTNVGKSSLLNALVGYDRAIVTDIEGTTRDTLHESYIYGDVKFNFIDTAGLRKTDDVVESLGIERSLKAAEKADVILLVADGQVPDEYAGIKEDKRAIVVYNKNDVNTYADGSVSVSAKTGDNIENLKKLIYDKVKLGNVSSGDVVITNVRHADCLRRAAEGIKRSLSLIGETLDCLALEVREAWLALGEITGTSASEDVVNRIFEKFCVGK